jgi:S1-C subfamily serine protease
MKPIGFALLMMLGLPAGVWAVPQETGTNPPPAMPAAQPAHVRRVEPAVVGIKTQIPLDRPSVRALGAERWGSGVLFDPAGYAVTVSYVLTDAEIIQVSLRDGRSVPATLVGIDQEAGLGVIKLNEAGPWPFAALGNSAKVTAGDATATIGVKDDNALVVTQGSVQEIRPFAGYWEYLLERAFIVAPYNPSFGGSPLVNTQGEVIGITNLRVGENPPVNVAIPIELLVGSKDELIARGRVLSRPSRPWLGLYTVEINDAVVVAAFSPTGPARQSGLQRGDVIVRVNGEKVEGQEDFYRKLWKGKAGDEIALVVLRESRFEVITVRSADRYQFQRTPKP